MRMAMAALVRRSFSMAALIWSARICLTACSSHSSSMPCSAKKSSKDEPTLPFFLRVISEHLLHTLERQSQIPGCGLWRFLDEAVQQYHAFPRYAENHPPDLDRKSTRLNSSH